MSEAVLLELLLLDGLSEPVALELGVPDWLPVLLGLDVLVLLLVIVPASVMSANLRRAPCVDNLLFPTSRDDELLRRMQ